MCNGRPGPTPGGPTPGGPTPGPHARGPTPENDLLAACVERGIGWLHHGGLLGAITSRTAFFLTSSRHWRHGVVLGDAKPIVMADLGHGLMDAAMVQAAAYVLRRGSEQGIRDS